MAKKRDAGLVGSKIVETRPMTIEEISAEGWDAAAVDAVVAIALVLDDGTVLYPSCDPEGNGPGALFGRTATGQTIAFNC